MKPVEERVAGKSRNERTAPKEEETCAYKGAGTGVASVTATVADGLRAHGRVAVARTCIAARRAARRILIVALCAEEAGGGAGGGRVATHHTARACAAIDALRAGVAAAVAGGGGAREAAGRGRT